ncbi:hypothetical protein CSV79_06675 [Sporosarcina sp. P13]|nr:hypothetical protein CSV79_06675 [Sporosarcina sp. P13]
MVEHIVNYFHSYKFIRFPLLLYPTAKNIINSRLISQRGNGTHEQDRTATKTIRVPKGSTVLFQITRTRITGHFHLTITTTVILTYFGIAYWLLPHLTGRHFTPRLNHLSIIQTFIWTIGMAIMSTSMHIQGLLGGPHRFTLICLDDSNN